jgi:nicotinate-nucleotide pyrophosphorylase (carboxylating)
MRTCEVTVKRDYAPVLADAALEDDCRQLIRLAVREDLDRAIDWTTVCLIDQSRRGRCQVVPRQTGICAGLVTVPWIVDEMDADLEFEALIEDGDALPKGQPILRLSGNARDLLTTERIILNLVSRLCGIATLTSRFTTQLEGTRARLYDTRKTTPGYRRLEKYAVGCGGGHNHRTGLFDGFLVKDNHLALGGEVKDGTSHLLSPRVATERARAWAGGKAEAMKAPEMVEIEVDSLDQLKEVLPARPDIVLVDNFSLADLRTAVSLRDDLAPSVELEASGNVKIDTIREIAMTGVERISSGALTHQAVWLDLGMDWAGENAT